MSGREAGSAGRTLLVLAVAVLIALPVSGCALAGRLLSAAGAASTVHDILEAGAGPPAPARTGSQSREVHAVVSGTGGSGLRLNRSPGEDRLGVLPEGTEVTVTCRAVGRPVTGPYGSTSTWSRVHTPDGRDGFMSDAYLVLDVEPAAVPSC